MYRFLLLLLFVAPAALAEKAWIGDIPGCSRAAAASGQRLPFGCANALNLAAMLNDPDDLKGPGILSPARGEVALGAVGRYRTEKVAPLPDAQIGQRPGD
ncbi:MAG: CpaD family pilus assembly lipoprotein [Sphingomonadaceae bacterium]